MNIDFLRKRLLLLLRFLVAGLPAFALAVPANYLLVEHAGLRKETAYAIVLIGQISLNFLVCKFFVFDSRSDRRWYREFIPFVSGILLIRCADFLVYVVLVNFFGIYFLLAQIANVVVFSVLKFLFSERVLT